MTFSIRRVLAAFSGICLITSFSEAQDASQVVENHFPVLTPPSSIVRDGDEGVRAHSNLRLLQVTPDLTKQQLTSFNTPTMIRDAYFLPSNGGSAAIAIVDPYDYPHALSDFNHFSQRFFLPQEPAAVATSANTVFQVVYAKGTKPQSGGYIPNSWNVEASLDTEWAHAIAPLAKIYLVEAASDSAPDLLQAVQVASSLPGVREVSMSWGSTDTGTDLGYNYIFQTPGIVYVAASGDQSAAPQYPATALDVIAVGGTTLNRNSNGTLLSESAWSDTGCGISFYQPRPPYQNRISNIVGNQRGTADVSFNANPNTGFIIYNSSTENGSVWSVVGGTSGGAPCVAGIINLAATAQTGFAANSEQELGRIYASLGNTTAFRDITVGHSGPFTCKVGWDFVTGVGSPLGLTGK